MELIAEVWRRAMAVQPPPAPLVVALAAVIAGALVLPRAIWPYTRVLVTITHEGAHGVAALLTGRRLQGIRLHSDASGLTVSSGRPSGPGMVTMLLAGYLGSAVVGLGAVALLIAGHSLGLLWLFVILLALLLVQIRNFYGFVLVVGCAVVLILVSWYLPATMQSGLAYVLTWTLLLAAPKPVLELIRQRRGGRAPHSDADQLARLTRVPASLWAGGFLIVNCAGLVLGTVLLLPALAELGQNIAGQLAAA
ncbi:MAG TPA: M50 family metallopeptidase [Propionibacteriaceae bacterium]|nr:M50 family metallopeptidase [Propionibacteriaceae bacterium]